MINYPFNIANNSESKSNVSYKNRGLSLEKMINDSNKYYRFIDKALIYKKPTPIHIVKTNKENIITEAFFERPSSTDYNGIYRGKYIDFEAKETKSKTSFSLKNIQDNQIEHILKVHEMGGISFLIIYFTALNKIFIYFASDLKKFIKENKRNSIPLEEFIKNGKEVTLTISPILNYLVFIDELLQWTSKQKSLSLQFWQLGLIALQ